MCQWPVHGNLAPSGFSVPPVPLFLGVSGPLEKPSIPSRMPCRFSYYTLLPEELCGGLIGIEGRNIERIGRESGAVITVAVSARARAGPEVSAYLKSRYLISPRSLGQRQGHPRTSCARSWSGVAATMR